MAIAAFLTLPMTVSRAAEDSKSDTIAPWDIEATFKADNLETCDGQLFRKNGASEPDPDDDNVDFFQRLRHESIPFPLCVHGMRERTVPDTQWFAT